MGVAESCLLGSKLEDEWRRDDFRRVLLEEARHQSASAGKMLLVLHPSYPTQASAIVDSEMGARLLGLVEACFQQARTVGQTPEYRERVKNVLRRRHQML
jgi:hypothetical protein